MRAENSKQIRCAIYTRKSTEHGLELEFNSLDAQREACESYIKSQASQGWQTLFNRYDDPAFSGGNLDRPALQQLLKDIDAGRIDVVVVYKIDRLTRSLADFAKLVEAFDAKSISFVAVTQQFNTTTSMGRLTLNVLLSFAQFERELSSERVRDKIAASRRKGKWTGGSVPLGYKIIDKKLIVDPQEAETVRYIFKRYLELKSFGHLVEDLDNKKIFTKRRETKVVKSKGGIPFTYGPLAYILKSRIYLGEIGHSGKWFDGEHEAVIDRATFDLVQAQLASNRVERKFRRAESGALLMGKLYDDRGNRMSPSYSVKNGARYRFYVSAALLRGRKSEAGSLNRVSATQIETAVVDAIRQNASTLTDSTDSVLIETRIERVEISCQRLKITLQNASAEQAEIVELPWSASLSNNATGLKESPSSDRQPDPKLIQTLARGHSWARSLSDRTNASIEQLAKSVHLHPNVIRQGLRAAFFAPDITEAILNGDQPHGLKSTRLLQIGYLNWKQQREAFAGARVNSAEI